jgi:hypothetical protein
MKPVTIFILFLVIIIAVSLFIRITENYDSKILQPQECQQLTYVDKAGMLSESIAPVESGFRFKRSTYKVNMDPRPFKCSFGVGYSDERSAFNN